MKAAVFDRLLWPPTHSSEIISDVPFKNVVIVQKRDRVSRAAARSAEIQSYLRVMGSIHSIQLSKIANKGVVLFVRGDDKAFLLDARFKMGARIFDDFSEIAIHEIKGKGNWQQTLGAADALRKASDGDVEAALLLDSDYMLQEQRLDYYAKAAEAGSRLNIWNRKEIENYFIIPSVIARYITVHSPGGKEVTEQTVERCLSQVEDELRQDLVLSYAEFVRISDRGLSTKSAFRRAEKIICEKIGDDGRLSHLQPGKEIVSKLSKFSKSLMV